MKPNPKRYESGTQPVAIVIGERVRSERQRKGWTHADLATALGASVEEIASIESGATRCTLEELEGIAAALGVTLEALVTTPNASVMTKRGVG